MKRCKVSDCDNRVKARGWCSKHYYRWYRSEGSGLERKPLKIDEARKAEWLTRPASVHSEKGRSPDPICGGRMVPVVCHQLERGGRRKTGVTLLWVKCERCLLKGEPVTLDK